MKLKNCWIVREDQWGSDLIKNEAQVYNICEDRKEGSSTEVYLGSLEEFASKNINSDSVVYKEAALYIKENYLHK